MVGVKGRKTGVSRRRGFSGGRVKTWQMLLIAAPGIIYLIINNYN